MSFRTKILNTQETDTSINIKEINLNSITLNLCKMSSGNRQQAIKITRSCQGLKSQIEGVPTG